MSLGRAASAAFCRRLEPSQMIPASCRSVIRCATAVSVACLPMACRMHRGAITAHGPTTLHPGRTAGSETSAPPGYQVAQAPVTVAGTTASVFTLALGVVTPSSGDGKGPSAVAAVPPRSVQCATSASYADWLTRTIHSAPCRHLKIANRPTFGSGLDSMSYLSQIEIPHLLPRLACSRPPVCARPEVPHLAIR